MRGVSCVNKMRLTIGRRYARRCQASIAEGELAECPFLALSGRATRANECLLLGAKRTWINRCLPNSIYDYTA